LGKTIFLATQGAPSAGLQAVFTTAHSRKVVQAFAQLGCHVAGAA
jgi:hypothetical protein